jgi:peroxiredoxin
MSADAYNTITTLIGSATLMALGVALYSFVFMLVGWKTLNRKRHIIRLAMALVSVPCLAGIQYAVLFLVILPALGRQQMAEVEALRAAKLEKTSAARIGDPVPQFSLTTADSDEFTLPHNGKVSLINFFATWCGPCQLELPHIEQIWMANKDDQHFRVLVIGREETTESVRKYRDSKGFTFPIAADPARAVYSLFASESIPSTLVASSDGRIVYSKAGFSEGDIVELKAVLKNQLASLK